MNNISINSLITDTTGLIRNRIRRVNKITIFKTNLHTLLPGTMIPLMTTRTPLHSHTPLNPLRGLSLRLEITGEAGNMARRRANRWWRGWQVIIFGILGWVFAGIWAEIGGFVHVDPETVDVDAIVCAEEAVEFVIPVALGVGVEPVRVDGCAGPDGSCFLLFGGLLEPCCVMYLHRVHFGRCRGRGRCLGPSLG